MISLTFTKEQFSISEDVEGEEGKRTVEEAVITTGTIYQM